MKKATQKAINAAIAKYKADIIKELTEAAPKAHIAGDLAAYAKLKPIAVDFTLMQAEALKYSKDYSKMLYTKGGSMIDGKFVPWLKDSTAQKRQNIAKIITDGLKAGKPTTAIGGRRLGKGTIAYDLAKECSDKGDSWAAMTARTETARIQGHGAMDRYKEQEIEEVKYLCGPDPCPICAANCQKVFKIGAAPEQPIHPRCVCDYAPVVKREKPEEVVKPEEKWGLSDKGFKTEGDGLWKHSQIDGKEHLMLFNGKFKEVTGTTNKVKFTPPKTSYVSLHTHPEWDSPLSGADIGNFLALPQERVAGAITKEHIYIIRKTAETKKIESQLGIRMFIKHLDTEAATILNKVDPKKLTPKDMRNAYLKAGQKLAKEFKCEYKVIKRT